MSSPAEQEYWPELLERLAECSVAELAAEYSLEPVALDAALAATSGDRPVQQEAWWPEVLRGHEHGSLRQLARRFGTNPRRLRRGLARCAVRVGGTTLTDQGNADLAAFRERLGQEPDRTLAAEAGVTLEAIKGERRRLGVEPYRMKPDVEEWGGKPVQKREKPRPRRRWQDAPEPVIIRRAGSSRDAAVAPDATEQADVSAVPVVARRSHGLPPSFRSAGLGSGRESQPGGPSGAPSGLRGLEGHAPVGSDPIDSNSDGEVGADQRRRRRFVRPTSEDEAQGGADTVEVFGKLPRLGARPPVRLIEPDQAQDLRIEPPGAPPKARARSIPRVAREEAPPELPAAAPSSEPEAPPAVKPARAAMAKRAVKAAPAPKPAAAPAPKPAAAPAPVPTPPVPAPVPVPVPAPVPARAPERGSFAWQVQVPGKEQPMLVLADDMDSALALASEHLGGQALDGAKAWRLAEVLREDREG